MYPKSKTKFLKLYPAGGGNGVGSLHKSWVYKLS